MLSNYISGSFLFILLASSAMEVFGGGACWKEFKDNKEVEEVIKKCLTKLNLKEADVPMGPELVKGGYDDKCLMKCVSVEMKWAKEDGTFDQKAIEENLKEKGPTGKADALIALWKECVETTAKDAAISKEPCKAIAKTKTCFMMGQDKICPAA